MARREARLKDGIEAVAIVTPNHMHFPVAKAFLQRGIHVICDKPLTATLKEAKKLVELAEKSGKVFALTHNYTGYPMVRQAREMVQKGELGTSSHPCRIRSGLADDEDRDDRPQAGRMAHRPGALGGRRRGRRHRHPRLQPRLLRFRPGGGKPLRRSSEFREGPQARRQCPCDAALRRRCARHDLGEPGRAGQREPRPLASTARKAGSMVAGDPNYLVHALGEQKRLITRGGAGSGGAAGRVTRVPPGHPEGYLEGFASIYKEAAAPSSLPVPARSWIRPWSSRPSATA